MGTLAPSASFDVASSLPYPDQPVVRLREKVAGTCDIFWSVTAEATSHYETSLPENATGEPDAVICDSDYGWYPELVNMELETLTLTFAGLSDQALRIEALAVAELFNAGRVVRVDYRAEPSDGWLTLWEGVDPNEACLGYLVIRPPVPKVARQVRVVLDTSWPGWEGIDAVGIIGERVPD